MQKLREIETGDKVLNYEDIYLVPNLSVVKSRSEVNTTLHWGKWGFEVPVVPSNMSSVVDEKIAKYCAFNHLPYFYHRFGNTFEFVQKANMECWPMISISIGVKQEDKDLLDSIKKDNLKVDIVLIDVAHGFSESVSDMIIYCRAHDVFTVAGNIWGDKDSIEFLQDAGAEAIKIGISCGRGCQTYGVTGFGSPMFSAAIEAGKWATVPVIIDGGIRNNGDVAKAIRGFLEYGSQVPLIMIGSLFSACSDSPGENIYKNRSIIHGAVGTKEYKGEITHKLYHGSASFKQKGHKKHIEGFEVELPCNGMTFKEKIQEIKESLQSACSYAGSNNLEGIGKAKWVTAK